MTRVGAGAGVGSGSGSAAASPTGLPALEIAVASPAGALAALEGGADRVELCVGLELGGLTPSQGLIEAVTLGGLPVHVLIRPRPGDFVFSLDDVDLMERETRAAVASGAAGVVIGALTDTGDLDAVVVERLVEAARSTRASTSVTFHRAIDQAADPVAVVAALGDLGVDRVLTSGAASRALDGAATLARVVEASGGVEVMAGGGVSPLDIPALVALGVDAVHLSAKRAAARRGGGWVSLGAAAAAPDTYFETDPDVVREARAALDGATR